VTVRGIGAAANAAPSTTTPKINPTLSAKLTACPRRIITYFRIKYPASRVAAKISH